MGHGREKTEQLKIVLTGDARSAQKYEGTEEN